MHRTQFDKAESGIALMARSRSRKRRNRIAETAKLPVASPEFLRRACVGQAQRKDRQQWHRSANPISTKSPASSRHPSLRLSLRRSHLSRRLQSRLKPAMATPSTFCRKASHAAPSDLAAKDQRIVNPFAKKGFKVTLM